ncbi:hypothetical protein XAUB_31610 [Xanthomonas citri pv. aurantifolii str. ICPB 11122]|nr:hypothetical protein XAUB_31610 [Xanthomonas citri pv. aurantifolii str. ICPB 11122]
MFLARLTGYGSGLLRLHRPFLALQLRNTSAKVFRAQVGHVQLQEIFNGLLDALRTVFILVYQPSISGAWGRRDGPVKAIKFPVNGPLEMRNRVTCLLHILDASARRRAGGKTLANKGALGVQKVSFHRFHSSKNLRTVAAQNLRLRAVQKVLGLSLLLFCSLGTFDLIQRLPERLNFLHSVLDVGACRLIDKPRIQPLIAGFRVLADIGLIVQLVESISVARSGRLTDGINKGVLACF